MEDAGVHHYSRIPENPFERPDPAAQFVLRDHEDPEIRRAPLQELTAELLEAHPDCLGVPHAAARFCRRVVSSAGGVGERIGVVREDR